MTQALLTSILAACTLGQAPVANVRDRSEPVRVALENALGKNREAISAADLKTVTALKLPHIHIQSFKEHDFAGLDNLKKLHFYSLLHNRGRENDPIAIGNKVFANLSHLEELTMNEQLGRLPDDVFSGLKSLRILDLTNATMVRLPRSMLELPKIETVYFDGRGMNKDDYQLLRERLGSKLQARRKR